MSGNTITTVSMMNNINQARAAPVDMSKAATT